MSNLTKYLVIVGILIAIGAMLLIFGSQTITGDLVIEEGKVNSLTQLEIKAELDPEINTQGVYAVQTIEGKEYDISAVVIDSTDSKIRDVSINRNSFEDNFEIEQAGTYTLIITTSESEETEYALTAPSEAEERTLLALELLLKACFFTGQAGG